MNQVLVGAIDNRVIQLANRFNLVMLIVLLLCWLKMLLFLDLRQLFLELLILLLGLLFGLGDEIQSWIVLNFYLLLLALCHLLERLLESRNFGFKLLIYMIQFGFDILLILQRVQQGLRVRIMERYLGQQIDCVLIHLR